MSKKLDYLARVQEISLYVVRYSTLILLVYLYLEFLPVILAKMSWWMIYLCVGFIVAAFLCTRLGSYVVVSLSNIFKPNKLHTTILSLFSFEVAIAAHLIKDVMDFISVLGVLGLVNLMMFDWDRVLTKKEDSGLAIVDPDMPASDPALTVDSQKRQKNQLKQVILSHKGIESITVGIDGAWGDGKTSIVEIVKSEIGEQAPIIWVRFEPWRYPTESDLIMGFYETIGSSIDQILPGLSNIRPVLIKFAQNIVDLADKSGVLSSMSQLFKTDDRQHVERLNERIRANGYRLVLVVDDLDRHVDNILTMRVLQLCHSFKSVDFSGSITIIPADFEILAHGLKSVDEQIYLQKITDINISVVQPTMDELSDNLSGMLRHKVGYDSELFRLIRNFRSNKRVAMKFNLLADELKDEVNIDDIFAMCVIENRFPQIFRLIRNYNWIFVDTERGDDFDWSWKDDKEKDLVRSQHLKRELGTLKDSPEREDLESVVKNLFPIAKRALNAEQGIGSHVDNRKMTRDKNVGLEMHLTAFFHHSEESKAHKVASVAAADMMQSYKAADSTQKTDILSSFIPDDDSEKLDKIFKDLIENYLKSDRNFDPELARNMLIAYFQNTAYVVRDDNSTLIRLLGAIDLLARNDEQIDQIFLGITKFIRHPSSGLRMLLYMHPTRNNHLTQLKGYSGNDALRKEVLEYTDAYYNQSQTDIFDEDGSDSDEWRFLLYQWGMSVSNDIETMLDPKRKARVNNYIQKIISGDASKLVRFVRGVYWNKKITEDEYRYQPEIEGPYILVKITDTVTKALLEDGFFDVMQRKEMEQFIEAVKKYQSRTSNKAKSVSS